MINTHPKIRVKYMGMIFNLKTSTSERNGKTSVDIPRVEAAKMIRQYIKNKYSKKIKSWVTSQSFSGGSSIDVNLSSFTGHPVSDEIFEDIDMFSNSLKNGKFNGMIDSYEPNPEKTYSDLATPLNLYTKFISVNNRPKFDSKEHRMINPK